MQGDQEDGEVQWSRMNWPRGFKANCGARRPGCRCNWSSRPDGPWLREPCQQAEPSASARRPVAPYALPTAHQMQDTGTCSLRTIVTAELTLTSTRLPYCFLSVGCTSEVFILRMALNLISEHFFFFYFYIFLNNYTFIWCFKVCRSFPYKSLDTFIRVISSQ